MTLGTRRSYVTFSKLGTEETEEGGATSRAERSRPDRWEKILQEAHFSPVFNVKKKKRC